MTPSLRKTRSPGAEAEPTARDSQTPFMFGLKCHVNAASDKPKGLQYPHIETTISGHALKRHCFVSLRTYPHIRLQALTEYEKI